MTYSEVRTFLEKDNNAIMKYLSIMTSCNRTLTVSPNHPVYARKGCNDEFTPVYVFIHVIRCFDRFKQYISLLKKQQYDLNMTK